MRLGPTSTTTLGSSIVTEGIDPSVVSQAIPSTSTTATRAASDLAAQPRYQPMSLTGKQVTVPHRSKEPMLWREDFPGIYVSAIQRAFVQQVCDALDDMLRFPESRAILVNISARHHMDERLQVTIEACSRMDAFMMCGPIGYAQVVAPQGTKSTKKFERARLSPDRGRGSQRAYAINGEGVSVKIRLNLRHAAMSKAPFRFNATHDA